MQKAEGRRQKETAATLVCFAVKEEAAPFRKIVAERSDVEILLTGIGRQNSERAVRAAVARRKPGLVLTCGFAGGLNPELARGTVVFWADADSEIAAKLLAAGARPARFFCASRIATAAAEKQELRRATGADAVEMESDAIHAVCREHSIPCATLRVISDTAKEDLPLDFNQLAKPDLSLDYGRLALAIAKSPGRIPALLRLQKNCRLAAERLPEVLSKVIWPK